MSRSHDRLDRLTLYARRGVVAPMVGVAAVTGAVDSADADLKIWSVGQAIPVNQPASQDLALTATFNGSFRIKFFGAPGAASFWGPDSNLQLLNFGLSRNDPAIFDTAVTFSDSGAGAASMQGNNSARSWFNATAIRTSNHEADRQLTDGGVGAFAIRFGTGTGYHYGWVELSHDIGSDIYTVERWALETDAGVAAQYQPATGAVPGLGGLTALAMGAAGIRRKRGRVA